MINTYGRFEVTCIDGVEGELTKDKKYLAYKPKYNERVILITNDKGANKYYSTSRFI